jgi:hypothetical protein
MFAKSSWATLAGIVAAIASSAPPATAASADGSWTMVAVTTRGHCGTVDIGLNIRRGRIASTSGSFAFYPVRVRGHVSASGRTSLQAIAGPRIANGVGRFGRFEGKGTWSGRGPSGLCSGVWTAGRS